jgi:uncharacterized protein (DUF169 family)
MKEAHMDMKEAAEFISNDLRLRTLPVAVKFLKDRGLFPDKTRRPSVAMGKRITICQAVTLARMYGWTVGLTKEDLICVPAMISFGFTAASDQMGKLAKLFCQVDFAKDEEGGRSETASMSYLEKGSSDAILLAPLKKGIPDPDAVAVYANPAQIMRMVQAWVYRSGKRIPGNFGGKVECTEYLIAAYKSGIPRVAIPGNGDRIFSMTQDDEMVLSLPATEVETLVQGLKEAGKKVGARYPITFYQNFQPEFPAMYKTFGEEVGAF